MLKFTSKNMHTIQYKIFAINSGAVTADCYRNELVYEGENYCEQCREIYLHTSCPLNLFMGFR